MDSGSPLITSTTRTRPYTLARRDPSSACRSAPGPPGCHACCSAAAARSQTAAPLRLPLPPAPAVLRKACRRAYGLKSPATPPGGDGGKGGPSSRAAPRGGGSTCQCCLGRYCLDIASPRAAEELEPPARDCSERSAACSETSAMATADRLERRYPMDPDPVDPEGLTKHCCCCCCC